MPQMRLASIAIDLVMPRREEVLAELGKYAGTDLVCYRAEHPPELVARQHSVWQPLVDWATLRFDAPLAVTAGIVPVAQPPATLHAFAAALAAYDPLRLTALHAATAACGSLVIALALIEGRLDAEAAFAAAQLDESFQIEQWGEDAEQTARRANLRRTLPRSRNSSICCGARARFAQVEPLLARAAPERAKGKTAANSALQRNSLQNAIAQRQRSRDALALAPHLMISRLRVR